MARRLLDRAAMHRLALALVLVPACGGCPWTHADAPTVSPATACLELHAADSSGSSPSTGCVDPVVFGHNGCSDALVIPAADSTSSIQLTFPAGADIQFEVPLDASTHTSGSHRFEFAIAAQLGAQPVTITLVTKL